MAVAYQNVVGYASDDTSAAAGTTLAVTVTDAVTPCSSSAGGATACFVFVIVAPSGASTGTPLVSTITDDTARPATEYGTAKSGNGYMSGTRNGGKASALTPDGGYSEADYGATGFAWEVYPSTMWWGLALTDTITITFQEATDYRAAVVVWYTGTDGTTSGSGGVGWIDGVTSDLDSVNGSFTFDNSTGPAGDLLTCVGAAAAGGEYTGVIEFDAGQPEVDTGGYQVSVGDAVADTYGGGWTVVHGESFGGENQTGDNVWAIVRQSIASGATTGNLATFTVPGAWRASYNADGSSFPAYVPPGPSGILPALVVPADVPPPPTNVVRMWALF